ncbi:hypothetical protein D3C73_603450 [compost metagenome]
MVGDTAVMQRLDQRLIGILQAGIFADDRDRDFAFRRPDAVADVFPRVETRLRRRLDAEGGQNLVVEAFLVICNRNVIDIGDIERLDDGAFAHVAEQRKLAAFRFRDFPVGAHQQDVGMNAERLQFLDRMLRRLGLQFAGCRNIRHQGQVNVDHGAARQVVVDLADRLHERHRLDIADRTADFAKNEIIVVIALGDEILDLVRHVRNDLDGRAEVIAAAFLVDDVLVDPAGGDVVGLGRRTAREPLVVTEIEIRLGTVVGHKDLAVLGRAHRARINVEIRIELLQPNPVTPRLEQCSEGRGRNSFSEGRNHAACDEYISRHGSHRLPFHTRFRQP